MTRKTQAKSLIFSHISVKITIFYTEILTWKVDLSEMIEKIQKKDLKKAQSVSIFLELEFRSPP